MSDPSGVSEDGATSRVVGAKQTSELAAVQSPRLDRGVPMAQGMPVAQDPSGSQGAPVDHHTPAATAQVETGTGTASKGFWTRAKVIGSAALAVVAAVTGIISIIPILTRDPSNISHLVMSAEPVFSSSSEWVLPSSAVLDEEESAQLHELFADPALCSGAGRSWLEQNATEVQRHFSLSVRSEAKEGPMLALTAFHALSESPSARGDIGVLLVCDPEGILPGSVTYAELWADSPDRVAEITRIEAGAQPGSQPTIPLIFNLAPGESGNMSLDLFAREAATGVVVMTVHTSDGPQDMEIPGSDFQLPAMLYGGQMYWTTTSDGLRCQRTDRGALEDCDQQIMAKELSDAQSVQ